MLAGQPLAAHLLEHETRDGGFSVAPEHIGSDVTGARVLCHQAQEPSAIQSGDVPFPLYRRSPGWRWSAIGAFRQTQCTGIGGTRINRLSMEVEMYASRCNGIHRDAIRLLVQPISQFIDAYALSVC